MALSTDTISHIERMTRHTFGDVTLLEQALTHSSAADGRLNSNERMEFLGDSVLGFMVCAHLFRKRHDLLEGELTKIKSNIVSGGAVGGMQGQVQNQLSQAKQQVEQKPFTAELLRHQDFSVEEAFAQFSVLQGVKSRLKQFGYDFFDAHARGFTSLQDVPVGPDYVIGPQDSLAIHIWNVPDPKFQS